MSYPVQTSLEAEVAYRREQLLGHYVPLRQLVGGIRQSRRSRRSRAAGVGSDRTTK